jgi:putative Mn2+ efflux pump MntP
MEVGAMAAAGHVALSVLLGFAVIGLGFVFSQAISLYVTEAVGLVMVIGGGLYGLKELRSAGNTDYERETREKLSKGGDSRVKRFRYFAVLGAALSPDLSILPVFLLAIPLGLGFAFDTAVVFAIASVFALLILLFLGAAGLAKALERVPQRYNDALVGFVIAVVGAYVLLWE